MLLDTASLYYRAFYGVPDTLTAPDGTPVNAVRGLLDMIARLVRGRSPAALIACMDADWRPAFRVAAIPSYKAHRAREDGTEEAPPALTAQIPVIEQVLAALGLAMAAAPGYEADDVIGTLTARASGPVEIVTGDRDLFQLVDDGRPVRVIYTVRGLAKLDVVDEAAVTTRYGIPGRAYADFAVLRGDPSDGLPGVPGVGDKTAAALVQAFGGIGPILDALDRGHGGFPKGSRPKLAAAREYLAAAIPVVRVAADAPVPDVAGRLPVSDADPDRLAALDARWGLGPRSAGPPPCWRAVRGRSPRPERAHRAWMGLEHPQRDQAGVVLGVGRAESLQHRRDQLLRVTDTRGGPGQRGEALIQGPVPALHQAVAVEQQDVAGLQGHRHRVIPAAPGAEQDPGRLPQRPRGGAADQQRRRVASLGPGEPAAGRIEVPGHHRGGVLRGDVVHQVIQPAHQALGRRAGDGQPGERAAQPGHARRRVQAVARHVADGEQDITRRHLGRDVPVAADPAVRGRGQVAHDRAQAGQIERGLVQRQDGALQLERDVTFLQ